jgi:hypothetical protein
MLAVWLWIATPQGRREMTVTTHERKGSSL